VVVVLFHRPAQLAPHPRAALDAGHGSKVTDVTAVAHDQPSTNCFVASWQKTVTGLCKRSAGARLVRPSAGVLARRASGSHDLGPIWSSWLLRRSVMERLRKLEMFSSGVLTECGCHRPPRYEPTPIVDSDFVPTGCIRQPVIRLSVLVGAWSR
jgi:hypothetical protein